MKKALLSLLALVSLGAAAQTGTSDAQVVFSCEAVSESEEYNLEALSVSGGSVVYDMADKTGFVQAKGGSDLKCIGIKFQAGANALTCIVTGGLKKGDVITITGATQIKESDLASKAAVVAVCLDEVKKDDDGAITNLITNNEGSDCYNTCYTDPKNDLTFTVTADAYKFVVIRKGNTAVYVNKIVVTRSGADDTQSTAIREINADFTNGAIYNLAGQKVSSLQSGKIYIQNGKKFSVK